MMGFCVVGEDSRRSHTGLVREYNGYPHKHGKQNHLKNVERCERKSEITVRVH